MAAGTKTFQTQFKIGAVWTGQRGVQQAQRSLGGLGRTAQHVNARVKGMARSVFAGVAAYDVLSKAIGGTIQILQKSFAAASEAQNIHDELGLTMERVAKRWKSSMGKSAAEVARDVEDNTQALIKASEAMEQTGHDAETLQKGFAKLGATGAMDPRQILQARDAFSDVLTYVDGVNASAEDSAQLGAQWADAIMRGNIALLKRMDLSDSEIDLIQKVNKQREDGEITAEEAIKRRQNLMLKFAKKFEGETTRAFNRPSGKIAQMWTQVGNIFETLGQPFVDRAPEMSEAFAQLAKDVKPAADEMARITAEGLKGISTWFKEHKEDIPLWLDGLYTRLKGVYDLLMLFDKIPVLYDLPKHMAEAQALMDKWKPGTIVTPTVPSAMDWRYGGTTGAPTTTEEANKQLQEAQKAAEARRKTGYAPYQIESQALQQQKRAEEAQKAAPTPPPTVPSNIGPQPAPTTPSGMQQISNAQQATTAASGDAVAKLDAKLGGRLKGQAATIFAAAAKHGVDPYLLAAIAQTESAKGTSYSIRKRNAPVGMMKKEDPSQHQSFATLEAGLEAGAALLKRGYISQGRTTPKTIGSKWAPVGAANDPNRTNAMWPGLVQEEMDRLKAGAAQAQVAQAQTAQAQTAQAQALSEGPTKKAAELADKLTTAQGTKVVQEPYDPQHPQGKNPWGVSFSGQNLPAPPPPPKPLKYAEPPKTSLVPAGSNLKDVIKEMNIKQRMAGASGGTNVASTNNITVNGVAPGREALMAKKTALAMRDPNAMLLAQIKQARMQEQRLGYV